MFRVEYIVGEVAEVGVLCLWFRAQVKHLGPARLTEAFVSPGHTWPNIARYLLQVFIKRFGLWREPAVSGNTSYIGYGGTLAAHDCMHAMPNAKHGTQHWRILNIGAACPASMTSLHKWL